MRRVQPRCAATPGSGASITRIYQARRLDYQSVQRWYRQDVRHFFSPVPSLLTNASQHTWRRHVCCRANTHMQAVQLGLGNLAKNSYCASIPSALHCNAAKAVQHSPEVGAAPWNQCTDSAIGTVQHFPNSGGAAWHYWMLDTRLQHLLQAVQHFC